MKKSKLIINLILICILIFSSYKIIDKFLQYKKAAQVYNKIYEIKKTQENKNDNKIDLSYINNDYRGWIDISNTNIHYPIVQAKDNDFYLYKDINKNYLESGSIFLDFRNNNFNDSNTVIYGHSMRNKTMFGQLKMFKDKDFFNTNKFITITTPTGDILKYKIFSAYITDANNFYNKTSFNSDEEFDNFLNKIKNKSLFNTDVKPNCIDKILTLSTCSYEFENARMVIHAKRFK